MMNNVYKCIYRDLLLFKHIPYVGYFSSRSDHYLIYNKYGIFDG